jgi:superfamily I DNA/RNA helicase
MSSFLLQEIEEILSEEKIVIKYDSYWFYLYFDYDIKLIEKVREIPRARYSSILRAWSAPLESELEVLEFATKEQECDWVASRIKDLLSNGIKASQIAVLYRINAQSEQVENALSKAGVEYQVRGGQRFFNRPEIMSAVRMVRAEAANPSNKELYETVSAIARSLGWQSIAPDVSGAALEKWEALNSLVQIADELGSEATIKTFASELEERQRSQHEPTRESITLSTIHAAKGLEYKAVFITSQIMSSHTLRARKCSHSQTQWQFSQNY